MGRKTTAAFLFILLSGAAFALALEQKAEKPQLRVIARSGIGQLLEKGCTEQALELRTARALVCPMGTDLSGSDAYEDVRVFATDLGADRQIRADLVWPSYTGAGSLIAVLDTGINYNHPELSSSYAGGRDFVNGDMDPADDNGHGTHVSGIITADGIASSAKGVAPGASILAGKVLDASGSGYISGIISAIYWAADNPDVDAISMSLGTSTIYRNSDCNNYISDLTTAINYAVGKGKAVVAAAGNNKNGVSAPGCISSVVTVGAVDSKDRIASFSGRGYSMRQHGVVAPGVGIYSAWLGASYATASGTSMATPMVSGTIALMKQKSPSLSVGRIKEIFWTTSKDLGARGYDTTYGRGRIDADAAVKAS